MFMLENVAILVWFAQPAVAAIERLDRSIKRQSSAPLSMVHIVKAPLKLPDDASRAAMLQVTKTHDVALIAMVVTESGFMLSMMRSVITGLRVVTAGRFDYRIEKSVEDVAAWLPQLHEQKTGVAIDAQRLLHVLRAADHSADAT